MAFRCLTAVSLVGLLALTGCDQSNTPTEQATSAERSLLGTPVLPAIQEALGFNQPNTPAVSSQRNWLSIPALPIIQEGVFSLKLNLDKQNESELMMQICGLARGDLGQDQVNAFLQQNKVEPDTVPKQGNPLSLLVNGDQAGQSTACAAYLATGVLSSVDAKEFMVWSQVKPQASTPPAEQDSKDKSDQTQIAAKPETKAELRIDQKSLAVTLPIKLAVARANADVFALIASELQRRPGLSIDQYYQLTTQLFAKLAPVYLKRIKQQLPAAGTRYNLLRADAEQFVFSASTGTVFEFGADGLILRQNGIVWYGQGKLLGRDYPLQVAYFDTSVNTLLAPDKQ
ncbi:hypothetical protein [Pseudomonas sp. RL_15y_Pfl2_60]|uniref:hypothetical protein n=1 Tax=Pseudomonas sp. RL_15y_Pfl2_60 TaxID=3088709 RepID=UPI0030DBC833